MVEEFTAAVIAKLAFETSIRTGASKLTEEAIKKGTKLWQTIKGKMREQPSVEVALAAVEKEQSFEILEIQIIPLLEKAMLKEPEFANKLQVLAEQIQQEIDVSNQASIKMNAQAYDQSTVKQVGMITAKEVKF